MPQIKARRHSVYVIRLDPAVLGAKRFREANLNYVEGKPCVYVGMTGLSPEERFENHKRGYKANRFVRKYGLYLMRQKFERLNPMTWQKARRMEEKLAEKLRAKGFAVWQG
jgi:hypothetical protein